VALYPAFISGIDSVMPLPVFIAVLCTACHFHSGTGSGATRVVSCMLAEPCGLGRLGSCHLLSYASKFQVRTLLKTFDVPTLDIPIMTRAGDVRGAAPGAPCRRPPQRPRQPLQRLGGRRWGLRQARRRVRCRIRHSDNVAAGAVQVGPRAPSGAAVGKRSFHQSALTLLHRHPNTLSTTTTTTTTPVCPSRPLPHVPHVPRCRTPGGATGTYCLTPTLRWSTPGHEGRATGRSRWAAWPPVPAAALPSPPSGPTRSASSR
jgi:hypothetical protein